MGHEVSGTVVEINGSTTISVGQDAFVFLCSDAASYVIGADIPVHGGWTIGDAPGETA